MADTFDFNSKIKKNLFIMMGLGLAGVVLLLLQDMLGHSEHNQHARLWSNILASVYFFTGIGLFGMFLVCGATLAYGSWHVLVKRVLLSLSGFTVIGGFLLVLIVVLGLLNVHSLYDHVKHILHEGHGKEIYTTKLVYFAPVFWIGRILIYAILWAAFSYGLNKFFGRTDQLDPKVYKRSKLYAAAFIVVFALTESAISWDVIMSLDPHWYSTLFGWYNFASYGCAAIGMTILLVIYLKSKGHLPQVNENHVHDLGKLLFGFSVFWTYLWFDQFMLQWYANIPEETNFWSKRFDVPYFKITIFLTLAINFLFPLLFLIKRGAKRNFRLIGFGSALLIMGHYVDFFNYTFVEPNWNAAVVEAKHHARAHQIHESEEIYFNNYEDALPAPADHHATPAADEKHGHENAGHGEGDHKADDKAAAVPPAGGHDAHGGGHHAEEPPVNFAGFGLAEILIFTGFLGLFLYLFFNNLAKRPIVVENDPYKKENEKLEVIYA